MSLASLALAIFAQCNVLAGVSTHETGLFLQKIPLDRQTEFIASIKKELSERISDEKRAELTCILRCFSDWKSAGDFLRDQYLGYPENSRIAGTYCWWLAANNKSAEAREVFEGLPGNLNELDLRVLQARIQPNAESLRKLEEISEVEQYARLTLLKIYYSQQDYARVAELAGPLTESGKAGPCLEAALPYKLHASALAHTAQSPNLRTKLWRRASEIDPDDQESTKHLWLDLFNKPEGLQESLDVANFWWDLHRTEEAALALVKSSEKFEGPKQALLRLERLGLANSLNRDLMEAYLLVGLQRYSESRRIYARLAREHKDGTALLGFVTAAAYDSQAPKQALNEASLLAKAFLVKGKVAGFQHAKICIFALLRNSDLQEAATQTNGLLERGVITEQEAAKLKVLCTLKTDAERTAMIFSNQDIK